MHQRSTREEDINHIMASLDEAGDNGHTAPLEAPEPLETYHIYPVLGGMVILKEEDTEREDTQETATETTLTQTKQTPVFMAYAACVFYLFLVLSCIVFQVYALLNPPIATVTIIPRSQIVTLTGTVQLGRLFHPVTISQSQTVPTTGKGHQDAAQAHGRITFYNGLFTSQTMTPGTILTGADGIHVVTDQEADIPAANPPNLGQTTVSAHAVQTGEKGNIPAFDINTPCCLTAVKAVNTHAFSGGESERDFQTVTTEDIASVATPLTTAVMQRMQGALSGKVKEHEALLTLPCTTTITPDHRPGGEATTVNVTVSQTCSGIVYDKTAFMQQVTTMLSAQAEHQVGTTYNLLGDVQIAGVQTRATNTPITLTFTAQSVWVYTIPPALERSLKQNIAGKTVQDALKYLSAIPGIQTVTIRGIEEDQKLPKSPSSIHFVIIA